MVRRDKDRVYDEYLAASARLGDRQALKQLAARWQPRFLSHAHRLTGDPELARDAAQEAWVDILRGIGRLKDAAAFPAWGLRIVTRRCAGLIRRRQRHREGKTALARQPEPQRPDSRGTGAETAVLRSALGMLPAAQQAALALFYLEDMSVAEIAVALDAPVGTVKTRLMHARRKLRKSLEGDEDA